MQYKNKIIALACATALLGANMTFATESTPAGMPWMEAFTKAMQSSSQMMQMSEDMYKKAMQTASGMQAPLSKELLEKYKEKIKNSWQDMEKILEKAKEKMKKQEIKKSALSQKTRDLFIKKLDQVPAEKQLEFYNKLIKKIDLVISKSKAEKTKWMLQELKMITQAKIDSFNESEEESLDDSSTSTWTVSE